MNALAPRLKTNFLGYFWTLPLVIQVSKELATSKELKGCTS